MANLYEIQKSVPIPSPKKHLGLTKLIREMEYGDSIVIPGDKISSVHPCAAQAGAKVKTRKNPEGTVLVWRVDEPEIDELIPVIPATIPAGDGSGLRNPDPQLRRSEWPRIERAAASPDLNLPEGYYFQEGPYTSRLWIEGKPPAVTGSKINPPRPTTPATEPGPDAAEPRGAATAPHKSADHRVAEIKAAVAKAKQTEDMFK